MFGCLILENVAFIISTTATRIVIIITIIIIIIIKMYEWYNIIYNKKY